LPAKETDQT